MRVEAGRGSDSFVLSGWPCAPQPDVPRQYRADPHDPATDQPGVYAWLLRREQRDHDRPDPRLMIYDRDPAEAAALIAQAVAAPPSELLAALQAGAPVAIPASRLGGNFYGPRTPPAGENAREFPLWHRVSDERGWFTVYSDNRVVAGVVDGSTTREEMRRTSR